MERNHTLAAVLALSATVLPFPTCDVAYSCPPRDPSLRQECADWKFAFVGVAGKVQGEGANSTTEFRITRIIKPQSILAPKKIVYLPYTFPRGSWLIFTDEYEGRINVCEEVPITPAVLRYMEGLLAVGGKTHEAVLRYCFVYLEDTDEVISTDAHREFEQGVPAEIARAAPSFSPRKLRGWLTNPKTPVERLGLYSLLLGHCGNGRDAELLHEMACKVARMKEGQTKLPHQLSAILSGYVLLDPSKGWACLREFIGDPQPFTSRYAALMTTRFLHKNHPDVIAQPKLIAVLGQLMKQVDIADIVINSLRSWRCWDLTDRVLDLYSKSSHAEPIIRRAIIRYALRCPQPKAIAFLATLRIVKPQLVAELAEILTLEEEVSDNE